MEYSCLRHVYSLLDFIKNRLHYINTYIMHVINGKNEYHIQCLNLNRTQNILTNVILVDLKAKLLSVQFIIW